jgi:nucleoside-diphosphate-sugar epimerase
MNEGESSMRIFVTGATGYIGTAVVKNLVEGGHTVTGLFHNPEKETLLKNLGAKSVQGDLRTPQAWARQAAENEAIIHTAAEMGPDMAKIDRGVVECLLESMTTQGITQSFVYTSGVWVLGKTSGIPVDEDSPADKPFPMVAWRPSVEQLALGGGNGHFSTAVVRPGLVYGGKAGIFSGLWNDAATKGVVTYVGEGTNFWSLIHREDLASLYRVILEKKSTGIFHGVDGSPLQYILIAKTISHSAGMNGDVHSWHVDDARKVMGPFADALALNQEVKATRALGLGWKPKRSTFLKSAAEAYEEWKA